MDSYGLSRERLLSQPFKVRWLGWETDTYSLQQNGWELSVDQCPAQQVMRMVIRHQGEGFIGQTNDIRFDHRDVFLEHQRRPEQREIWEMRHMGRSIMVAGDVDLAPVYARYKPIDAAPRLTFDRVQSLDDLVPFAGAPLVRSKALILPEATVDDLLKGILERQQEAKVAFFEDLVAREGAPRQAQKFHAQIISLSDYREAA